MKDKRLQRVIVTLYLRKRKARRELAEYLRKDEKWTAMKDQARGSLFEASMALKAVREAVKW